MSQNNKQYIVISPEDRIYMTCKFLFCIRSDTESQLQAVCSFSYTECYMLQCCRQKCVNTLAVFKRNDKGLYQEGK